MIIKNKIDSDIINNIKSGGVGVIPTDTIYGLIGMALSAKTVNKIYTIRKRGLEKPMIILISSLKDLELFEIKINSKVKKIIKKYWPGKISIILPCPHKKFFYLHKNKKTLAFRLPSTKFLINLIKKTGPLVAPSANIEGMPPSKTINEAKKYFNEKIDFYVNHGKMASKPSTIIKIQNEKEIILRE